MSLTPLELPGWLEFNTWRSGLEARRISQKLASGGSEVRAVLYLDRRGRVRMPPNNPYLPVVHDSSCQVLGRRTAEWLRVAVPLVEEMRRRGIVHGIALPPDLQDIRPWSWGGLQVAVRYSYLLDFPFDPRGTSRSNRTAHDRAATLTMRVDRIEDVDPVIACLTQTETRKGFSHDLGRRELEVARDLLGPDSLRMYACFDRDGQPASTMVAIHAPGSRAIGWIGGSSRAPAHDGATQLLWRYAFSDLESADATGIDLCGANLASVAAFKSQWGARLVPYFVVRTFSLRAGMAFLADWHRSRRSQRSS